ncbi:MAG: UDP-2,4-diacetamido-2,4,6-trideoxy-beta-L-altropyranose hydrolase [Burkholderiaceae bacterium]
MNGSTVIALRTDASLQMGSGHVMRCLTLADALKAQGAQCHFISRQHPGHLLEVIHQRGHAVTALPAEYLSAASPTDIAAPTHAEWLGCGWHTDAQQTSALLDSLQPDWLVVDHYALDQRWEEALAANYRKLLVIDDLADRPHVCDVLLDQTFGRSASDYHHLVPTNCSLLCGTQYALLRPEFAILRPYSLQRRQQSELRHLLITMGGVDKDNATGQVLQALQQISLPLDCTITVVMGATAPWLQAVQAIAQIMPWPTQVLVGVSNMAQLMADSDLAIGAAGATTWERCCLGLPSVMMVLADNQRYAARQLQATGAVWVLDVQANLATSIKVVVQTLVDDPVALHHASVQASKIADGQGCAATLNTLHKLMN